MKQVLGIFASYNKGVNEKLIGIIEALPEDQFKKDMGTFYRSLFATYSHVTMSDVNWLARLKGKFPYASLANSSVLDRSVDDLRAAVAGQYRELFALRKAADIIFIELIKEVDDTTLETAFTYKNKRGEELSKKFGHILLHLFNHQTHHRGEMSALLDMQNVTNDYSGMMNYL
jgi:uncharacterized damage-inducible protein DinB